MKSSDQLLLLPFEKFHSAVKFTNTMSCDNVNLNIMQSECFPSSSNTYLAPDINLNTKIYVTDLCFYTNTIALFVVVQSLRLTLCNPMDGGPHARLPCPSLPPRVCPNWCPLSQWCHLVISCLLPPSPLASILPSIRVFSNELVLCIRWPKYWSFSFSISPSNVFRVDFL